MEHKGFSDQVVALEKLAKDEKGQLDLGRRLIKEVAQSIYEEKRGQEISNPDIELTFRKGDEVPSQLRGHIATDLEGRAIRDTSIQSLNLRIWIRIWVRFWVRIVFGAQFQLNPLNRFQDFADQINFSGDELALLNRLKKID